VSLRYGLRLCRASQGRQPYNATFVGPQTDS